MVTDSSFLNSSPEIGLTVNLTGNFSSEEADSLKLCRLSRKDHLLMKNGEKSDI